MDTTVITTIQKGFIKINNPVLNNIRIGSALKDDLLHAFNDIIDNYAGNTTKFPLIGGDILYVRNKYF